MGFCPNCGNWVDEGDICGFCGGGTNSGRDPYFESDINAMSFRALRLREQGNFGDALKANEEIVEKIDEDGPLDHWDNFKSPHRERALKEIRELKIILGIDDFQQSKADMLGEEAWELYMNHDDAGALVLINQALSHDDKHANNWNKKAIILEGLERFEESKECYDKSLSLNRENIVVENKARMLRTWASDLYDKGSDLPKALNLVNEAINELSKIPTEENIERYRYLSTDIQEKIKAIEKSKQSKDYDYFKNNLSNDVIREITKEGHSLESQIICLIEFINYFEKEKNCIFNNKVYYSDKYVDGLSSGVLIEFAKKSKYINSTITCEFIPGNNRLGWDQNYNEKIDEELLFNKPPCLELKQTLENDGYQYGGITIYNDERLSILFSKEELLFRRFKFSLKDNEIISSEEYINVSYCYYSFNRTPERQLITREVERIKKEYNCSLVHIEPPTKMYFEKNGGNESLLFVYNYETKKIEKPVEDLSLEKYPKEELIVITGTFHDCIKEFKEGMRFKLMNESDNEDAYNNIAVYLDDNKIGYVTNSFQHPYGTSTAKDINIPDNTYAEYLLHYYDSGRFYHILHIMKNKDFGSEESNPTPEIGPELEAKVAKLHNAASTHLSRQEYDKAITYLSELIVIQPTNISFLQTTGYCYHELRQCDEALKCFNKVLELDPNNYNSLFFKAKILENQGRHNESTEYLDKVIKLRPNDENNWFYKAFNLVALKQYAEADLYFNKAIELNPKLDYLWYQKGFNLVTLNQYGQALVCFDKALMLNPRLYHIWYFKGKVLTELNRYEEAIKYLDRAFELNPKYTLALNTKGIALSHLRQFDKAMACFDEAILLNPKDSYPLKLMGNLFLMGLKDYPEAIKYFKEAIKLDSEDSMLWNNLGDAYLNTGEFEKGLECCEKARSLNPNNFRAWFTTSEIYYELQEYGKAMEYATKAEELNPTDYDLLMFIKKIKEHNRT